MSEYTKILEFFVENGITLSDEQLSRLSDIEKKWYNNQDKYGKLLKSQALDYNQVPIPENEKGRYSDLFVKFKNFLQYPQKLKQTSSFNFKHITNICQLINMSPENLNNIVSKNIKPTKVLKLKASWFNPYASQSEREKIESSKEINEIGDDVYNLGIFGNLKDGMWEGLLYSIKNKKLYYINTDKSICEIFYNPRDYLVAPEFKHVIPISNPKFKNDTNINGGLKKELIKLYKSI